MRQDDFMDLSNAEAKLEQMARQTNDPQFLPTDDNDNQLVELIQAEKISKKLKTELREIKNPSRQEVKTLINLYSQMQANRIALRNQIRAIEQGTDESGRGNILVLDWCAKNAAIIELGVKDTLGIIAEASEVGRWLLQITGIGPVLAAGCLAYFDVSGKEYSTQFISYCGLNNNNRPFIGRVGAERIMNELLEKYGNPKVLPDDLVLEFAAKTQWPFDYLRQKAISEKTGKWSKTDLVSAAAKIPYNRELRALVWKIGQSFVWQTNNPKSLYGGLLAERKILETRKNEAGEYADQAAEILRTKNIGKTTIAYSCYSKGMLPKAHINARAERWVTKIFVSHLFEEMYRVHYDRVPPRYYILDRDPEHNKEIQPEVPYYKVKGEK